MRLLFIRHGDPDYEKDSLTETGWKEAALLADKMVHEHVDEFFVSPLGRAKDTASFTLERTGRKAEVMDWLQEFPVRILRPDTPDIPRVVWDWLPEAVERDPAFLDPEKWKEIPILKEAGAGQKYDEVCRHFDELLAQHGYVRDGMYYRVEKGNKDTLCFFCQFCLAAALISHLVNCSPYVLWQGFCALPSSITTFYSEERRPGIAAFRCSGYGDVSHLYAGGQEPSFSARFCEQYEDDTRH